MKSKKLWEPSQERIHHSNLFHFLQYTHHQNYADLYQWSIQEPEKFWESLSKFCKIKFIQPPQKILDNSTHQMLDAKWFVNATLNFAENLLSRQDNKPAIIFCNENNKREVLTYKDLYQKTAFLANELRNQGIGIQDRVAGYLPNIPEAVIAMLATTSIGAIWTAVSPDFGVNAVLDRFTQIAPKILIAQSSHFYQGKYFDDSEKIQVIHHNLPSVEKCYILNQNLDLNINTLAQNHTNLTLNFTPLPFNHPIYILYSSGTTGLPKCIVHGAGGTLLQHVKELKLHSDLKEEDIIMYYTSTSWMMWNWLISSLSQGATIVLYDGSPLYPKSTQIFDIVDQEKISILGISAKYLSAAEKNNLSPIKSHRLDSLKTILSTGSPLLPEQFDYVYQHIKSDICLSSISGGTDIISCFALGCPILPVYRSELQCIGLGMKVEVYNSSGKSIVSEKGELVCTQPFPSMPIYFWNDANHEKYHRAYFGKFTGIWSHGDYAEIVPHEDYQSLIIYGRSDAVLNPGGIRIGTAEIYRLIENMPEIVESLAAGKEENNDISIILFVKLKIGVELTDLLKNKIIETIKKNLSPHHIPSQIIAVPDIPRTLNGKIVELAVRETINNRPVKNLEVIANPEVLKYFNLKN